MGAAGIETAIIATERLVLVPLQAEDADELCEVLDDDRLHEFTGDRLASVTELHNRFVLLAAGSPRDGEDWLNWVVRRRLDSQALGTVQVTVRSVGERQVARLGWMIGIPWQGKGYASEAAVAPAEEAAPADAPAAAEKPRRGRAKKETPKAGKPARERPARRRDRRPAPEPGVLVRAQARYVRTSARKARLVCDHIRGKDVAEARAILAFTPRAAAKAWIKLLESAVANAEHNHELIGDDLRVFAVSADEGPTLKRYRPRAMGRATRIRKRTSHLTITLTPKESNR